MRILGAAVVCGFVAALLLSAQTGSARTQSTIVNKVGEPVWGLAMDWPRVAYVTGRTGSSEAIYVWNVATGATSVVGGGVHAFAVHHTSSLAISGRRVVWLRSQQIGNTELEHWLYTARVGGPARRLRRVFGGADLVCGPTGPSIGGLVGGAGTAFAVSLWNGGADGSAASRSHEKLALVRQTGVQIIATGANAVLSESADSGHIAVLPLPATTVSEDGVCLKPTSSPSVFVYSTSGSLLQTIALPTRDPSTVGYQVAIQGSKLVVMTDGWNQSSGLTWVTLTVYRWTTGALLHTWPVAIPHDQGELSLSFYGKLAAVDGPYRLHLVNLDNGHDVRLARASATTAFGRRGLVYAVNSDDAGSLVFVPTARLLALAG